MCGEYSRHGSKGKYKFLAKNVKKNHLNNLGIDGKMT
jgi:hypothetical protein